MLFLSLAILFSVLPNNVIVSGEIISNHNISREAAKISALSSGKMDKYEHFTGEEILSSKQGRIQQTKFTNFSLGEVIDKETKKIEDHREKQTKA